MVLESRGAAIGARIAQDVSHRLAVIVHAGNSSWAVAVVWWETRAILAWDGWYTEQLSPAQKRPLSDLPFADWDDLPSKLLLQANQPWLADQLGFWLMPTYSVAYNAAELVGTHFEAIDEDAAAKFATSPAVAYLPVTDEAVFLSRLSQMAERHPVLSGRAFRELQRLLDVH